MSGLEIGNFEKKRRLLRPNKLLIAGGFGALVAAYPAFILGSRFVDTQNQVFDCSAKRGGTVDISLEKGKEYSMKPIFGSSAELNLDSKGEIVVFIKDSDNRSATTSTPVIIEDAYGVYKISEKNDSGKNLAEITATCKPAK